MSDYSEHVPECLSLRERLGFSYCFCPDFAACEQRVREDDKNTFLRAAYDTGREDGVQAARDAVEGYIYSPQFMFADEGREYITVPRHFVNDVIAAINGCKP